MEKIFGLDRKAASIIENADNEIKKLFDEFEKEKKEHLDKFNKELNSYEENLKNELNIKLSQYKNSTEKSFKEKQKKLSSFSINTDQLFNKIKDELCAR